MSHPVVSKAVKEALEVVKDTFPEQYQKLQEDPVKKKELIAVATAAAEEEVNQQDAFSFTEQQTQQTPAELQKLLSKKLATYLPSDRVELIKNGLQIPTYRLNFRHEGGVYYVDFTKSGEKYMESITLDTAEGFSTASAFQIASIVVEAIALIMSIVGISVPADKIAKVAAKVTKVLSESPAVQAAIKVLQKVFSSGGSGTSKATAIWELVKAVWNLNGHNVLITIVKLLLSDWGPIDIAIAVAKIVALIAAAVATGGAALIAKIVLALASAYEFVKKILNMNELDAIRKELDL